jgi:hypothetical protein
LLLNLSFRQTPSPLQLDVESTLDTRNFDELWTSMPLEDSPVGSPSEFAATFGKLIPEDPFAGYDYQPERF